ncbi:unnamed protein product [Strongylus vulgaris]|uniref:Uncharacterized protein n=1 Tax=Strongylus vulgaris TaxID=40348 RepID=A0A3P7JGG2_STRVU|nr:unnamed protein product [Strongylus vulgaris]
MFKSSVSSKPALHMLSTFSFLFINTANALVHLERNVEVLSAEVAALKVLVQTPGMGHNHFLHTSPEHKSALAKLFSTSCKLTTSAKRSSSSGAVLPRKSSTMPPSTAHLSREREKETEQKQADLVEEVDPILMSEFTSWREAGHPFVNHPFMDRINIEEISPCMLFPAKDVSVCLRPYTHRTPALSDAILDSIAANKLELEPVHESKPSVMPCALTNVSRFCPYRVRVAEDAEWHRISLLARNRIAAVCDYYTFIRYLRQGLIKSGVRDSYFDMMTLRKNMCLAKLGLGFVPKTNLRPGF